jgi:hypothetical protein
MRILVCPVAVINAPVETILELLELQNWDKWIDGKVEKIEPSGKMIVGQEATLSAKAFFITWKVKVIVTGIDKKKHIIRYDVFDPLGLKNEEKLEYKSLTKDTCEVRYNCNFILKDGILGQIQKLILGKKLIDVPEDSIQRLKREAEREQASLSKANPQPLQ